MYCPNCGAEISDTNKFCPECGFKLIEPNETIEPEVIDAINQNPNDTGIPVFTSSQSKLNTFCLVGMVLGICSMMIDPYGFFSFVALILSIIGINDSKKKNERGKTQAIVGIVLSCVEIFSRLVLISMGLY